MLVNAARSFNTYVPPAHVVTGSAAGGQRPAPGLSGMRPGDSYNAQAEWPPLLQAHGWRPVGQRREVTLWKRPSNTTPGCSATTNYAGSKLLYVFSTKAHPFKPARASTLFAAYALRCIAPMSPRRLPISSGSSSMGGSWGTGNSGAPRAVRPAANAP